jgi:hypothetical protein
MKTGIEIVMGKPGSGKSTYCALEAKKYMKKGYKVWSNVDISGTYMLNVKEDLMKYHIENGLVIIDEAGKEFNARDFKKFTMNLFEFFTLHRHYKLKIILAVQFWDRLDKVIRELVRRIYIVRPTIIPGRIRLDEVGVKISINDEGQIYEKYFYIPMLFGGVRFKRKRPAFKMFDTYERDELEGKKFELWGIYKSFRLYILKKKIKIKVLRIIRRFKNTTNRITVNAIKLAIRININCKELFKSIKNIKS